MLDADHVVSVGVLAHEFDDLAGEGWRVPVLPRSAGQGPGPFAIEPPGADATPLQEDLLHVRVLVELEDDGMLGVFVHARLGEESAQLASCFMAEGVECPASTIRVASNQNIAELRSYKVSWQIQPRNWGADQPRQQDPPQRIGGSDLSVCRRPLLIDTRLDSLNCHYVNPPTRGFSRMPKERRSRSLAVSPPTPPGWQSG